MNRERKTVINVQVSVNGGLDNVVGKANVRLISSCRYHLNSKRFYPATSV